MRSIELDGLVVSIDRDDYGELIVMIDTEALGLDDTHGPGGVGLGDMPRLSVRVGECVEALDDNGAWVPREVVDLVRAGRAIMCADTEGLRKDGIDRWGYYSCLCGKHSGVDGVRALLMAFEIGGTDSERWEALEVFSWVQA